MIKRITDIIKLALFLSWSDKDSRKATIYLTSGLASCIFCFWTFPLQNLTTTGTMSPETQLLLRITGTETLIAGWLISLNRLIFYQYNKYKATHRLTRQELDDLSTALQSPPPKTIPDTSKMDNDLYLLELAQKAYGGPNGKSKDARKLVDTLNSLSISESAKYTLYEKVILIDKGRPAKSNPFKKE